MPLDQLPKALIDAGGWVTAAAIAIGVVVSIIRDDLVSGKSARNALDRETKRADKATEQLERNSDIGERIVAANDKLSGQVEVLIRILQERRPD